MSTTTRDIEIAVAAERERCAAICESEGNGWRKCYQPNFARALFDTAAVIRGTSGSPEKQRLT